MHRRRSPTTHISISVLYSSTTPQQKAHPVIKEGTHRAHPPELGKKPGVSRPVPWTPATDPMALETSPTPLVRIG